MSILALWIRTAFLENMTHRMLSLVQTKTLEVGGVVPTGKSISVACVRSCVQVCQGRWFSRGQAEKVEVSGGSSPAQPGSPVAR